jgi:hypothetical protein
MTQPMVPGGPLPLLPNGPAPLFRAPTPAVAPTAEQVPMDAKAIATAKALKEIQERETAVPVEGGPGAAETGGAQFVRGVLDYVMGAPALLAMQIEGTGELTGIDALRDFGRDFGKSASGRELMSTYMSLAGIVAGDTEEGISDYERSKKRMLEQEEAWPMLSTVSHLAGAVGAGLGAGSLVSGASSLGQSVAAASYEGAGLGAADAYSKNASLRDVMASTLIGAAAGGTLTYGFGRAGQALHARAAEKAAAKNARTEKLTELLGAADEATARASVPIESAGGKEGQSLLKELLGARAAAEKAAKGVQNGTVKDQLMAAARQEFAEAIDKKAGQFAAETWATKAPTTLQKFFRRTQILDKVSDDVVTTASRVGERRPSLDDALDLARLTKLTKKTADAPAAIGKLQTRVGELMGGAPHTAEGDALRLTLRGASSRLMKAELPAAMKDAHELVRTLGKVAMTSSDDTTRAFAERAAQGLADDMTDAAFGDAGKLYSQLVAGPGKGFAELADRELVREALRTMAGKGQLPDILRAESMSIVAAHRAAEKLTGKAVPAGLGKELQAAEALLAKAEDAVTLDGGPMHRIIDWFKDKAEDKVSGYIGSALGGVVGGWPGAVAGNIVGNAVKARIGPLLSMVKSVSGGIHAPHLPHAVKHFAEHAAREKSVLGATGGYLGGQKHAGLSPEEKHKQFDARAEALQEFASATDHEELLEGVKAIDNIVPGAGGAAAADMQERMTTLSQDLIRPKSNIRGKAFETLSAEDLRKNNAMWEATVDPMSVYGDLASGAIDYDKLNYAWKQYPGLLEASQMALVDIVHTHLDDSERASIPEHVLSQLDLAFKMNGSLTKSLDQGLSKRVDAANQQLAQQSQNKPQGQLKLPGAKPTTTQRIANG